MTHSQELDVVAGRPARTEDLGLALGGHVVVTRESAEETLRRLAHGLDGDEDARVARLLERVASGGAELRDALVVEGAKSVVREVARVGGLPLASCRASRGGPALPPGRPPFWK